MGRRFFGETRRPTRSRSLGRAHLVDQNGEEHDGGHFYHRGYHDPNMCPTCVRQRAQQQIRRNKKPCNCR